MTFCTATACSCLTLAGRTTVAEACRTFGVHRSTYYRWKRQVDRHGLGMLRPRERRAPRMPNQLSVVVEQRIVAYSLGHPGQGPDRISSELARPKWGGILVSANGVWRVLRRHGLNTQHQAAGADRWLRQRPYQPVSIPLPEPHILVDRPGELVGIDCFFVGRLKGTKAPGLAGDGDRLLLLVCLGRPGHLPDRPAQPAADQQARSPGRSRSRQSRLEAGTRAHRQRQRVSLRLRPATHQPRHPPHPHPRRPTPDQRPRRTPPQDDPRRMLAAQLRPLPPHHLQPACAATSPTYIAYYNTDRAHNGRITKGRIPTDIIVLALVAPIRHQVRTAV